MGLKSYNYFIFRLLFGIALLCLGLKGYISMDSNKGFISQNIRLISEKFFNNKIDGLRSYSGNLILLESSLIALAGILFIIGHSEAKLLCFVAALIDIILVHNPFFYREPKYRLLTSGFVAIYGAALSILD